MTGYFSGRYYKHQNNGNTIAFIIGHTADSEFIQIITDHEVIQYHSLEGCQVSSKGLRVNYPAIQGKVQYGCFLPLRSHIMGPFHFLPMQCNHEVVSMLHSLYGSFTVHGQKLDFTGGLGYIEGDYGRSFPKEYLWLHCNEFRKELSIMISIADIPFCGFHFIGCICAITYNGREYRLATYRGVRVHAANEHYILLTQGRYRLDVRISNANSYPLRSPKNGKMVNTIHECNCAKAAFRLKDRNQIIFEASSKHCSFEYNR